MLQPSPASNPSGSAIFGNTVSVASQYIAQEHGNESGQVNQEASHDRSETVPDYPREEISTEEQAVGNGETEAGRYNPGKE